LPIGKEGCMAFQDELRDILVGFVPEDKKEEFTEKSAGIFEKMGTVFNESAASIAAQKTKIRELEAKAQTVTSADPEEFSKVLRQLEDRDKILESKQKELDEVNEVSRHLQAEQGIREAGEEAPGSGGQRIQNPERDGESRRTPQGHLFLVAQGPEHVR